MTAATTRLVNRRHFWWPTISMMVIATAVNAGELSCHGEVLFDGGEAHSIDLSIKVSANGRVLVLTFDDLQSDTESDNPLAVHACSLNSDLPEIYGRASWSGSLAHQRLELVDAFNGERSSIKIAKRENSYSIQFGTMSRSYCGQMSFPAAVVISSGSNLCSVHFPSIDSPREPEFFTTEKQ